LLEEIKKSNEVTPVIIITAYGSNEVANETIQKGGFDFITKHFRMEQFLFDDW
jgi:DNA-binding NtrC family response regulator